MRVITGFWSSLVVVVCSACRGDVAPDIGRHIGVPATVAAVATPDSAQLTAAQRVMRAFLDASRESSLDPVVLDTLGACGEGGQSYFPTTMLAGYTLLAFEARGDTIVSRAEVVTVAEQDIDRRATNRFVARQRVRSDVLEWDVIPDGAGRWAVCNGLRFGYRGTDSLTTWRPDGASYESARQLADSIAAARQ